jgi:cytochrome P450
MLRELGPAVEVELPAGLTAWAVPRHADLRRVLTDPRVVKGVEHWAAMARGEVPAGWPMLGFVASKSMINVNGESHERLEALVGQAYTPRRVEALRPRIVKLVDEMLDALAEAPPGTPVDLRVHFVYPIPTTVICELLGIPEGHGKQLHELTNLHRRTTTSPGENVELERRIDELLRVIIAERREDPGDDLISAMLAARQSDGDRLSEDELVATLLLMFFAGHQTTLNLIVNAVRALLTHPEQKELVLSGAVPWGAVVEETLRWDGPVNQFPMRFAVQDLEIGGVLIRKGDAILASYGAAGRDPRQHGPTADRFDLTREQRRHLAFGHGTHSCLGAALGRIEAEIALSSLFARFPELRLAADDWTPVPLSSFVSNSIEELPVLLGPDTQVGRESST